MRTGELVRVWTDRGWRPGRFVAAVERGKRSGDFRVEIRALSDGRFRWREIRVRPDSVRPIR